MYSLLTVLLQQTTISKFAVMKEISRGPYRRPFTMVTLFLTIVLLPSVKALVAVYLSRDTCGGALTITDSVQVESSTGLTYLPNMDCTYTIQVAFPYLVLANIKRFEFEPKIAGVCHDYVNLHDGSNTASGILNREPLCGGAPSDTVYVSSGQRLTIHFVTDGSAVYLGFNIIFTKASTSPCDNTQYLCNNTFCIPSSVVCDSYDQCGDVSDEQSCTESSAEGSLNVAAAIAGSCLGLAVILCIIVGLVYRAHRRNQWRRLRNEHIDTDDVYNPDPSYPVTYKYLRGIRGHPGVQSFHDERGELETDQWMQSGGEM